MKVGEKKFVSLSYQLHADGVFADEATRENPLKFVFGAGFLLPKFEEHIAGLESGDRFTFTLTADEGYGQVNPQMVIDVPKDAFMVNGAIEEGLLTVGNQIPMMTSSGQPLLGHVVEVNEKTVKMDFNHPMAGKTLVFTGEIIEVREATEEDYPHQAHGCDCGCGCSHDDCGGDCCGDHGEGHECGHHHDEGHECGHGHGCHKKN